MSTSSRWAMAMAMIATGTALCLSTIAGWQRGGSPSERIVWVAIGVVLIVGAHLLPTLIRDSSVAIRVVGTTIWGTCMITASYGHLTFFLLAQQHAGEARASAIAAPPGIVQPARSLTAVMADRATVTRELALARAQRCAHHCPSLDTRRVTLAARLDALDAAAQEIRRHEVRDDRLAAERDALRADPVASRLAALLGTSVARVDLLSGMLFAAVLEGIACLSWTIALRPPACPMPGGPETGVTARPSTPGTRRTQRRASQNETPEPVTDRHVAVTRNRTARDVTVTSLLPAADYRNDIARLSADIEAGRVRATVADIRRYLRCSQAKASALRRELTRQTR